jgi:hypothetical protein
MSDNRIEQLLETVLNVLTRLEAKVDAQHTEAHASITRIEAKIDTQHSETQSAVRDALATTVALGSWLREQPIDNPPPVAGKGGILDKAVEEVIKTSRAGSALAEPSSATSAPKTKPSVASVYFGDQWATSEQFRADYAAAKAGATMPKRTSVDTDQTYLVKEGKAVHKVLPADLKAKFVAVYAAYKDALK